MSDLAEKDYVSKYHTKPNLIALLKKCTNSEARLIVLADDMVIYDITQERGGTIKVATYARTSYSIRTAASYSVR
jgi:hypothetical protein